MDQGPAAGTVDSSAINDGSIQTAAPARARDHRAQLAAVKDLGLVDAVPDATFEALARMQAKSTPETAGRPNTVTDLANKVAVGKFGWKAQVPTLLQFAADAYLNEMGITSPFFPNENCPQGDCSLLTGNPAPGLNDDGAGVEAFANFMTLLAPPPRGPITKDVAAGKVIFMSLGCASCHVPELKTGSHPVKALAHQTFFPFSASVQLDSRQPSSTEVPCG